MSLALNVGLLVFFVGHCMACDDNWKQFEGSCYKFFTQEESWTDAQMACEVYGAYLVEIGSEEENEFVKERLNKYNYHLDHHIGATDRNNEGVFQWAHSSSPLIYTNWMPGEPNQWGGEEEDCVEMRLTGWNDIPCYKRQYFVCERKDEMKDHGPQDIHQRESASTSQRSLETWSATLTTTPQRHWLTKINTCDSQ